MVINNDIYRWILAGLKMLPSMLMWHRHFSTNSSTLIIGQRKSKADNREVDEENYKEEEIEKDKK